jgi:hypothetical protein
LRIAVRRRLKGGLASDQGPEPRGLHRRRAVFIQRPVAIGSVLRGIELDQYITLLHHLTILHMDGSDQAGFELLDDRLDDLGVATGNDLALSRGDNVDPAQAGPQDRGREDGHDGPENRATDGRRGTVLNLQHGREKLHRPAGRDGSRGSADFSLPGGAPDGEMAPEIDHSCLVTCCCTVVLNAQRKAPHPGPLPRRGEGQSPRVTLHGSRITGHAHTTATRPS